MINAKRWNPPVKVRKLGMIGMENRKFKTLLCKVVLIKATEQFQPYFPVVYLDKYVIKYLGFGIPNSPPHML